MSRRTLLAAAVLSLPLLAGCNDPDRPALGTDVGRGPLRGDAAPGGPGPRPGDADAAVGDAGRRSSGTSTGDAPSVESNRDDRINAPLAR